MIVPGVRRLAVLRANGIGDFVFALPALEALRRAYPAAEITLLGLAWHARFLEDRPTPVDRVVVVPPVRGVGADADGDPHELEAWFDAQRHYGYDLALQIHGGGRHSNPFLLKLGARLTAGLQSPDAVPLDRVTPYVYWQNEYLRCLEAVALVGALPGPLEPSLTVLPRDRAEASRYLEPRSRLALLHVGAGDPKRRWPEECFIATGKRLHDAGLRVLVSSGSAEAGSAARIACGIGAGATCVAGKLSLGGLLALIEASGLVVGNDSGPLHLAVALRTPAVGIFWAGNLVNAAPPFRARFRPVLSWRVDCARCGARTDGPGCGHTDSIVDLAALDEVLAASARLLAGQ